MEDKLQDVHFLREVDEPEADTVNTVNEKLLSDAVPQTEVEAKVDDFVRSSPKNASLPEAAIEDSVYESQSNQAKVSGSASSKNEVKLAQDTRSGSATPVRGSVLNVDRTGAYVMDPKRKVNDNQRSTIFVGNRNKPQSSS